MSTPGEVFDTNHDYRFAAEQRANPKPALAAEIGKAAARQVTRAGRRLGQAVEAGFNQDPYQGSLEEIGLADAPELPRLFNDEPHPRVSAANTHALSDEQLLAAAATHARSRLNDTVAASGPDTSAGIYPAPEASSGKHRAAGQHRRQLSPAEEAGARIVANLEENYGQAYPEIPRQPGEHKPKHSAEEKDDDKTNEYPLVGAGV